MKTDTDSDNLTDGEEVNTYNTNPNNRDTDGESISDGDEVNIYFTDPANKDTDGDMINDKLDNCPLIFGKMSKEEGKNGCPSYPKVGTKTDFSDIYFIVDSDEFNFEMPETERNLEKLLRYINQCNDLEVVIEGHTSLEGTNEYNKIYQLEELRKFNSGYIITELIKIKLLVQWVMESKIQKLTSQLVIV